MRDRLFRSADQPTLKITFKHHPGFGEFINSINLAQLDRYKEAICKLLEHYSFDRNVTINFQENPSCIFETHIETSSEFCSDFDVNRAIAQREFRELATWSDERVTAVKKYIPRYLLGRQLRRQQLYGRSFGLITYDDQMYHTAVNLYLSIIEIFGFTTIEQAGFKYQFMWNNADTFPDIDLPYDTGYPMSIFTRFKEYVEFHESKVPGVED